MKALKGRRFERAAALFAELRATQPDRVQAIRSPYAESLEQWALRIQQVEPKKVSELLKQALKIDSTRLRARLELACLYTASGQHEKAIQTYEQIAEKEPLTPEAVFNLAYPHARARDYARAEPQAKRRGG